LIIFDDSFWFSYFNFFRKNLSRLEDFLHRNLQRSPPLLSSINISAIAPYEDLDNTISLFETILSTAITSDNRNDVIFKIMDMGEKGKEMIKVMIERGIQQLVSLELQIEYASPTNHCKKNLPLE